MENVVKKENKVNKERNTNIEALKLLAIFFNNNFSCSTDTD